MSDDVQPPEEQEQEDEALPEFPPVSGGAPTDIVSFDIEMHA
jgi:hypothetical protein